MKDTIIIVAIILVIVLGDIVTKNYLNKTVDELLTSLETLKEKVICR